MADPQARTQPMQQQQQQRQQQLEDGDEQQQQQHSDEDGRDEEENEQPEEEQAAAAAEPLDTSIVYAAFGRDTAAGRALFNLYNKNKSGYVPNVSVPVAAGGRPDPLAEFEAKRRSQAAALIKPKYAAPKLKKVQREPAVPRVPLYGGKKTTDTIDRERSRDAPLYKAPSVPLAVLQQREVQKLKLQEAMEGAGKKSAVLKPLPGRSGSAGSRDRAAAAPQRDPNQVLYDAIIDEIEERHTFLDSMRARGDNSHDATIKAEIAQRLRELKQLEALIAEDNVNEAKQPAAGRRASAAAASSSK